MITLTGSSSWIFNYFDNKLKTLNIEHISIEDNNIRQSEHKLIKSDFIIHLGENYCEDIEKLNNTACIKRMLWGEAAKRGIPFFYLSKPNINNTEYEKYNLRFDLWVQQQVETPPFWAGIKVSEVFGDLEYDKYSIISTFFQKIEKEKKISFYNLTDKEGNVINIYDDFIYVDDVINVLFWFMSKPRKNNIYDLCSGFCRQHLSAINIIFQYLKINPNICCTKIEQESKNKNTRYNSLSIKMLREIGYKKSTTSLEKGIKKIVILRSKNKK